MRVTEKKKAANRKNAQKSTGPKTDQGKLTASANRTTHGLHARALILNSPALKEDLTEYCGLVYALDRDLGPEGLFEEFLVRKIANCLWRSRRVIAAENAQIERQLDDIESDVRRHLLFNSILNHTEKRPAPGEIDRIRAICIGSASIPNETVGRHLMRYEMRLDRQLSRSLRILAHLQNRRKLNQEKEKEGEPLDLREQSQISCNPIIDNPLADIE